MTNQENSYNICDKCALFGSCKDSSTCTRMVHSKRLGLGKNWFNVQAEHQDPDNFDEVYHNYFVSFFSYLAGKGVDLTKILIVTPMRFIAHDVVWGALKYTIDISKSKVHDDSIETRNKRPFVRNPKQLIYDDHRDDAK